MNEARLEHVKQLATTLSPADRARLATWLDTTAEKEPAPSERPATARPTLYGLCADLGPGPSDEDIAEVRRVMWSTFPREDIA